MPWFTIVLNVMAQKNLMETNANSEPKKKKKKLKENINLSRDRKKNRVKQRRYGRSCLPLWKKSKLSVTPS